LKRPRSIQTLLLEGIIAYYITIRKNEYCDSV